MGAHLMAGFTDERRKSGCVNWWETMLWFVPKRLKAKADQPWRYGVFLGRALGSDQNMIGLPGGDVVRARAMVRRVPCPMGF